MYERLIQSGSKVDKRIAALSHATSSQLAEAWNSVKGMKERLETAKFLSQKREALMQQLRGNRAMLDRMREMPYAVPSKQMAALMRKITEVYDSLDRVEHLARDGFASATGALAAGKPIFTNREPQRYAKYSFDPLMCVKTYPLGFHLLVLGFTEIPLRVMLANRGFEKRSIGPLGYYYHPGDVESQSLRAGNNKVPIVFVHGIGVGLLPYVKMVDLFLETGRPIFLPEIPYVSGFRPWVGSTSVLTPTVVASTVSFMRENRIVLVKSSNPFKLSQNPVDCNARNTWLSKWSFCWTLLRHVMVELCVQICYECSRRYSFLGPYMLLLAHS